MIITVTIDTNNYAVSATTDEDEETSVDYSSCDLSALTIEEIMNDF